MSKPEAILVREMSLHDTNKPRFFCLTQNSEIKNNVHCYIERENFTTNEKMLFV